MVAVTLVLVASFKTLIRTPGRAAPDLSVALPVIDARSACALITVAPAKKTKSKPPKALNIEAPLHLR